MKAAVIENNHLKIVDIDSPRIMPGGVLIRTVGCGVCSSDIIKIQAKKSYNGMVLGHEVVGIVEKSNSKKLQEGDRVVFSHHYPCFTCHYCIKKHYSMCYTFKTSQLNPGGFAEKVSLTPGHIAHTTFTLLETTSFEEAMFTEPLGCCLRAIKRSFVNQEDNVAVIGAGSIGLLLAQLAKLYGAEITVLDLLEERLQVARHLGIRQAMLPHEAKPKTYDKVFLAAGSSASIDLAMNIINDGGMVTVFSSVMNECSGFANNEIYFRELTVMGSYSPSPQDMKEALGLIESNQINVKDILTHKVGLKDINNGINLILENKALKVFVEL